jgi:hypothetical protein
MRETKFTLWRQNAAAAKQAQMTTPIVLDFAIIGADKSGTSLLVDRLRRSSNIALPAIEVRSFRDPFYPEREPIHEHFAADEGRLKGVKHPIYLSRPEVPARLAAHNPRLKLIALLREPASRTIASYLHYVRNGQLPLIEPNQGIAHMLAAPDAHPKYRDIILSSAYGQSFERYLQHFSRQQMHVATYETFIASPHCLAGIFKFLNVEAPPNAWPPPHINPGAYDWSRIAYEHAFARATLIYDEAWNIIGRREAPAHNGFQEAPRPVSLAPETQGALARHFSAEGSRLVDLGIFSADPWAQRP